MIVTLISRIRVALAVENRKLILLYRFDDFRSESNNNKRSKKFTKAIFRDENIEFAFICSTIKMQLIRHLHSTNYDGRGQTDGLYV